jgi:hypothetical protein
MNGFDAHPQFAVRHSPQSKSASVDEITSTMKTDAGPPLLQASALLSCSRPSS